ncbi:leucine-rich repeat domain-containing protein [Flavobacterium poyangense]|uniref:leucine-rich repeat domain-containing protein n=1 Tax=Flavobacterium poyangense TaxID=2204302 RepID=UPI00142146C8|nr:leucine-rich repeat domain-containing protein [Flavobacterium sp. JXAS1]
MGIEEAIRIINIAASEKSETLLLPYLELTTEDLEILIPLIAKTDVTELTLIDHTLQELPKSIDALQNLNSLILRSDKIKILPESIGNLPKLNKLIIKGESIESLPQSISDLTNLGLLYVTGNRFETLPKSIGNLKKLYQLGVESRRFSVLPEFISNLPHLEALSLPNSAIRMLPENLRHLQNLKIIDLRNNPLSDETMIWLTHIFRPEVVAYNMAAHDQNQTAEEVLQLVYTNPDEQKSIIDNIENCDLESGDIYYGGASQAQSKPAKDIINEFLSKVQIHSQYDQEFYGPPIKSTLDGILNKEHFTKEERVNNLAIMTTSMGDCSTPIREALVRETVKQFLTQEDTLPEINQIVIEKEALRNAISRLEGYWPNEKIEQAAGLLNSIYLSGAENNPKNQNLQIVGERIRLPSITPYPDFAFQQIQSNSELIKSFVDMVCQTDDHNQPIRHDDKYCLDLNKIKKIKDQYIASFKSEAEQQNEKKNPKPQLDKFTIPINEKESPRPKSPDQSGTKHTNETRLTPKR